jgi:tetratricopeptide (TPR) repeat protein
MCYNFARSYFKSNRPDKGYEFLIKALNTGLTCSKKLDSDAHFNLVRDERRFKELLESLKRTESALELEKRGILDERARLLEEACGLSPDYCYPFYLLARCYAQRGDREKALLYLEKSIRLGYSNFCVIVGEPLFEKLKASPEFQRLLKTPH